MRGLMTKAQMAEFADAHGRAPRAGMGAVRRAVGDPGGACRRSSTAVPFFADGPRRHPAPRLPSPPIALPDGREISTQAAFGKILDALAKAEQRRWPRRIVTTSPDVTVSTNLGPWVNRRGLFARDDMADTFRDEKHPVARRNGSFSPEGQHIELGIAEMNLFLMLGAAGLSHSLFGERLIPIGTRL